MDEKSRRNLGEVLARLGSPKVAADGLRTDRDRIAGLLRAARVRIKEREAKEYREYLTSMSDPRD